MGDLIHRGPESRKCVKKVFEWQEKAPEFGSNIIVLLGNHEWQQIFHRYGFIEFEAYRYKGPYYVPKEQDQGYLESEEFSSLIKDKSLYIVRIGTDLFTHSGFGIEKMERLFKLADKKQPDTTDEIIHALNDIARKSLDESNNEYLSEVFKDHFPDSSDEREVFDRRRRVGKIKLSAL